MTSALFSFSWSRAQVRSARGRALAPRSGCPARRSAAFLDRRRGCAIGGSLGLGACAAQIVLIGGIFAEPVVERVADFQACGADEVDALDRLVNSFAIENSSAQLLDPDAEQLAVLALDFSPAGFVLGKVGIFVRLVRHIAERGVLVALGSLALARSAHRESPCRLARASDEAAVLLADQVEALAAEAGELGHLALGSATGTDVFLLEAGVFLSGLCLLLCHNVKCSRLGLTAPIWIWKSDQRLRKTTRPLDATIWPGASTKVRSRGRVVNSPTRPLTLLTGRCPHLLFSLFTGCRGHPGRGDGSAVLSRWQWPRATTERGLNTGCRAQPCRCELPARAMRASVESPWTRTSKKTTP